MISSDGRRFIINIVVGIITCLTATVVELSLLFVVLAFLLLLVASRAHGGIRGQTRGDTFRIGCVLPAGSRGLVPRSAPRGAPRIPFEPCPHRDSVRFEARGDSNLAKWLWGQGSWGIRGASWGAFRGDKSTQTSIEDDLIQTWPTKGTNTRFAGIPIVSIAIPKRTDTDFPGSLRGGAPHNPRGVWGAAAPQQTYRNGPDIERTETFRRPTGPTETKPALQHTHYN